MGGEREREGGRGREWERGRGEKGLIHTITAVLCTARYMVYVHVKHILLCRKRGGGRGREREKRGRGQGSCAVYMYVVYVKHIVCSLEPYVCTVVCDLRLLTSMY